MTRKQFKNINAGDRVLLMSGSEATVVAITKLPISGGRALFARVKFDSDGRWGTGAYRWKRPTQIRSVVVE